MARPLRIEYAGACYHVINRGNYRRNLFDRGGAEAFERVLDEAARRFGWRVHAYVIMRNHYHMAVEIAEPDLSEGMKWLQGTWIRRYNSFRRMVGRPFQGRYKALLVEPGLPLAQVCHYIHLNPVRAGIVSADKVESYAWSSLPKFRERKRLKWLEPSVLLAEAGNLADSASGWRQYGQYLEFLATDGPSRKTLVAAKMSRGWCLGGKEFREQMRKEAAERGAELDRERFAGLEPEGVREERSLAWEEQLRRLAERAEIDLEHLPPRKSAPDKALLAAAMKKTTSVSNGWLADRLEMGPPASASQFARRYLLTEAGGKRVARAILSNVKT
jgi:putative transposase